MDNKGTNFCNKNAGTLPTDCWNCGILLQLKRIDKLLTQWINGNIRRFLTVKNALFTFTALAKTDNNGTNNRLFLCKKFYIHIANSEQRRACRNTSSGTMTGSMLLRRLYDSTSTAENSLQVIQRSLCITFRIHLNCLIIVQLLFTSITVLLGATFIMCYKIYDISVWTNLAALQVLLKYEKHGTS